MLSSDSFGLGRSDSFGLGVLLGLRSQNFFASGAEAWCTRSCSWGALCSPSPPSSGTAGSSSMQCWRRRDERAIETDEQETRGKRDERHGRRGFVGLDMGHNLWRAILGWMNIHLPPILMFTGGYRGFDPQPFVWGWFEHPEI